MIDFVSIEDDSSQLKRLIDEGKIFTVEMYECPVSNGWFLKHKFVIFETTKWWWSVEKNDEGITIQRSKNKDHVKNMFELKHRPASIKQIREGDKNKTKDKEKDIKTTEQFFQYMAKSGELSKAFCSLTNNCNTFSKAIYNKMA